jgi:small subunit ribosomal protein S1
MAFEQEINSNNPKHQEFAKLLDQDFKDRKLIENQIIKAKVVEILKSYIVCDAKAKSEAMIPISEFKEEELSKLKIGDTINCFLERIESMRSGEIVLSYQKAKSFAAWEKCLKAFENEEELTGIIQSKIKGGFICELFNGAISAFLPQSHLDTKPIRGAAVDRLMRTPIKVKIVRLEKTRGNVSCSRRAVLEKNKNAEIAEALKTIKEGMIVDSQVRAVNSWGVFVSYNNLDMLVHVSDLDFGRVKQPSDLVTVGQTLKCKIIKIDPETNRISASVKDLNSDPYENIEKKYKIGSTYPAEIVKLQDYGAFAALEKNIEGLIHQSYLSHTSKTIKPNKVFSVGDKISVKILSIEKDKRRISLDYKSTLSNPWDKIKDKLGSTVKFKINNITDKALFGDLEGLGITSMCHWKELNFSENIDDLKKFSKGQIIDVKLISLEDEKAKVSKRALDKDPWDYFKENKKKVGNVITARVIEVSKTGSVKVAADPDKKIISTIRKSDLALEAANARSDIFSGGEKLDCKIVELDFQKRILRLSPKEAQKDEQASLIKKFGKNASKSGQTLASIFKKAMGKKEEEK